MSGFAPYTPVYGCGNDGPGAKNLLYWFDQESPWAGTCYNLGVCACRGTGSGATSQHARCRAGDIGIPMIGGRPNLSVGNAVVMALVGHAGQLGLTEVIWNRRRWSARFPQGAAYGGVSPHYDHVHYALSLTATRLLNVPTVRNVMAGTVPPPTPPAPTAPATPTQPAPPQEDDEMAVMVRLNIPGHPHHGRVESVTAMHRRWVPTSGEVDLHRFLGGPFVQCPNVNDWNNWTSNKEVIGGNAIGRL